jgi:hypothetical protein
MDLLDSAGCTEKEKRSARITAACVVEVEISDPSQCPFAGHKRHASLPCLFGVLLLLLLLLLSGEWKAKTKETQHR